MVTNNMLYSLCASKISEYIGNNSINRLAEVSLVQKIHAAYRYNDPTLDVNEIRFNIEVT